MEIEVEIEVEIELEIEVEMEGMQHSVEASLMSAATATSGPLPAAPLAASPLPASPLRLALRLWPPTIQLTLCKLHAACPSPSVPSVASSL